MPEAVRRPVVYIAVFLSGAAVLVFELLGPRMLAPVFGSDITVWTAVLGVTLGYLAVGYLLGGMVADRFPKGGVLWTVLLLAGASFFLVGSIRPLVLRLTGPWDLRLGATGAAAVLFAAPLCALGAVGPVAIRVLVREMGSLGKTAGRVFALSTAGSVLGAFLAGFLLIPRLGITQTLVLLSVTLSGAALAGCVLHGRRLIALLAVAAGVAAPVLAPGPPGPAGRAGGFLVLHRVQSAYGEILVADSGPNRLLFLNGILQTAAARSGLAEPSRGSMILHGDLLELLPYYAPLAERGFLIGLGGGLAPMVLRRYGMEVKAVEIDPEVVAVARSRFAFSGSVAVADGRRALQAHPGGLDFIIIDAFAAEALPFHLFTREMFALARERLQDDGILAIHSIGTPAGRTTASLVATLGTVFRNIHAYGTRDDADEMQMLYLFATNGRLELRMQELLRERLGFDARARRIDRDVGQGAVYTDDDSPVDVENAASARRWREQTRRRYPDLFR